MIEPKLTACVLVEALTRYVESSASGEKLDRARELLQEAVAAKAEMDQVPDEVFIAQEKREEARKKKRSAS